MGALEATAEGDRRGVGRANGRVSLKVPAQFTEKPP